jgi:hypothetical protein
MQEPDDGRPKPLEVESARADLAAGADRPELPESIRSICCKACESHGSLFAAAEEVAGNREDDAEPAPNLPSERAWLFDWKPEVWKPGEYDELWWTGADEVKHAATMLRLFREGVATEEQVQRATQTLIETYDRATKRWKEAK